MSSFIRQRPGFRKISFIAHSIGGLVARYAIGKLYRPHRRNDNEEPSDDYRDEASMGTVAGLVAVNFITVATPHLGSRGHKQVPFFSTINLGHFLSFIDFYFPFDECNITFYPFSFAWEFCIEVYHINASYNVSKVMSEYLRMNTICFYP